MPLRRRERVPSTSRSQEVIKAYMVRNRYTKEIYPFRIFKRRDHAAVHIRWREYPDMEEIVMVRIYVSSK
jgi:hypothetical protein